MKKFKLITLVALILSTSLFAEEDFDRPGTLRDTRTPFEKTVDKISGKKLLLGDMSIRYRGVDAEYSERLGRMHLSGKESILMQETEERSKRILAEATEQAETVIEETIEYILSERISAAKESIDESIDGEIIKREVLDEKQRIENRFSKIGNQTVRDRKLREKLFTQSMPHYIPDEKLKVIFEYVATEFEHFRDYSRHNDRISTDYDIMMKKLKSLDQVISYDLKNLEMNKETLSSEEKREIAIDIMRAYIEGNVYLAMVDASRGDLLVFNIYLHILGPMTVAGISEYFQATIPYGHEIALVSTVTALGTYFYNITAKNFLHKLPPFFTPNFIREFMVHRAHRANFHNAWDSFIAEHVGSMAWDETIGIKFFNKVGSLSGMDLKKEFQGNFCQELLSK